MGKIKRFCVLEELDPVSDYHLSYEIEIHAATTYGKYLAIHGHDDKILEILNDEIHHAQELENAIKLLK